MSLQHVVSARARSSALDCLITESSLQGLVSSWVSPLPVPPRVVITTREGCRFDFCICSVGNGLVRAQARLTVLSLSHLYRDWLVAGSPLYQCPRVSGQHPGGST